MILCRHFVCDENLFFKLKDPELPLQDEYKFKLNLKVKLEQQFKRRSKLREIKEFVRNGALSFLAT